MSRCKVPWLGTATAGEGAQPGRGTVQAHSLERGTAEVILCHFSHVKSTQMSCKQVSGIHHRGSFPSTMRTVLMHRASVSLVGVCLALPEQAGRAAGMGSAPVTHLIIYLEPDDLIAPSCMQPLHLLALLMDLEPCPSGADKGFAVLQEGEPPLSLCERLHANLMKNDH